MFTIPSFAVLLTDIPASKAYLQGMIRAGYVPEKVVLVHLDTRKPSDSWARRLIKFFPAHIQLRLFQFHMSKIQNGHWGFDPFERLEISLRHHHIPYEEWTGQSMNDPAIVEKIRALPQTYLLYTSGGILRDPLFSLGKRWLHIHPGYLPFVKGSHGLNWSVLTRGKAGASCFFMNQGIDTGELLHREEFPAPQVTWSPLFPFFPRLHAIFLDWALQFTYDPYLRSEVLLKVLEKWKTTGVLEAIPHDAEEGATYHDMHPTLIGLTVARVMALDSSARVKASSALSSG